MVIDARTLSLHSGNTGFDAGKAFLVARSPEQLKLLEEMQKEKPVERKYDILIDYSNTPSIGNRGTFTNHAGMNFTEMKFFSPYELDYSFDEAIHSNWLKSSQRLDGVSKEDYLSYVRENGLNKEIDWNTVYLQLQGGGDRYENFTAYTDYAAAVYASLENRIINDFQEDEQSEQLEMLNKIYENNIEDRIKYYLAGVNEKIGYSDINGIEIPTDELSQGIRDVMTAKREAYSDFVKSNADYADFNDGQDKWLDRDIVYMSNVLRNSFSGETTIESTLGEKDIIAIGALAEFYSNNSVLQFNDEESLGLALAMNYLAATAIMDKFDSNETARSFGANLYENYSQRIMDYYDKAMQSQRDYIEKLKSSDGGLYDPKIHKTEFYPALNRDDINAVVNAMVKVLEESQNATKAIHETTSVAFKQFLSNQQKNSEVWRYNPVYDKFNSSKSFWNNLYDNGGNSAYIGKILSKWEGFTAALESGSLRNLSEFTINTFHNYRN